MKRIVLSKNHLVPHIANRTSYIVNRKSLCAGSGLAHCYSAIYNNGKTLRAEKNYDVRLTICDFRLLDEARTSQIVLRISSIVNPFVPA